MRDYINQQTLLAEQFILTSTLTNKASYEAVMQIKRWKMIHKVQGIQKRFIYDAVGNVFTAYLNYIPNQLLLHKEGFFITNMEN